jgi:hypothetical protein
MAGTLDVDIGQMFAGEVLAVSPDEVPHPILPNWGTQNLSNLALNHPTSRRQTFRGEVIDISHQSSFLANI